MKEGIGRIVRIGQVIAEIVSRVNRHSDLSSEDNRDELVEGECG
jgi:hypothetical protein